MARFRTRPFDVEAVRWAGGRFGETPDWLIAAIDTGATVGGLVRMGNSIRIFTSEGVAEVSEGDWIVRLPDGTLQCSPPDVFAETFDGVAPCGFNHHPTCDCKGEGGDR